MFKLHVFLVINVVLLSLISINLNANALPTNKSCFCTNTFEILPVCGSDGYTYTNAGAIECKNMCSRTNITVVRLGKCKDGVEIMPL